jgi:ribosomal protein L7Ae-like RNA K-turn-binding protein
MCATDGSVVNGSSVRSVLEQVETSLIVKNAQKVTSSNSSLSEASIGDTVFKLSFAAQPFVPSGFLAGHESFDRKISATIRVADAAAVVVDGVKQGKPVDRKTQFSAGTKYTDEMVPKKYVGALGIEKQPKRSALADSDLILSTAEVDSVIKEMLQTLDRLQRRALERDPVHGKLKERFVKGIKQATNVVKTGRARVVFVASDTEESESLDGKLQEMIKIAKEREIPILYCLSRRLLGKAVGSTFRQSAVAVHDPDGAYPEFKKIIAYIETAFARTQTI